MVLTNRLPALIGLAALLALAGCRPGSSKVSDALGRAKAGLEMSEAGLKGIEGKAAEEAVKELDKVYEAHQRVLEELTGLANESFTPQERERYGRVLALAKERQAQIKEATAKVQARLKQRGKG